MPSTTIANAEIDLTKRSVRTYERPFVKSVLLGVSSPSAIGNLYRLGETPETKIPTRRLTLRSSRRRGVRWPGACGASFRATLRVALPDSCSRGAAERKNVGPTARQGISYISSYYSEMPRRKLGLDPTVLRQASRLIIALLSHSAGARQSGRTRPDRSSVSGHRPQTWFRSKTLEHPSATRGCSSGEQLPNVLARVELPKCRDHTFDRCPLGPRPDCAYHAQVYRSNLGARLRQIGKLNLSSRHDCPGPKRFTALLVHSKQNEVATTISSSVWARRSTQ